MCQGQQTRKKSLLFFNLFRFEVLFYLNNQFSGSSERDLLDVRHGQCLCRELGPLAEGFAAGLGYDVLLA